MDRYRAYVVPGRGLDPEQAAVVEARPSGPAGCSPRATTRPSRSSCRSCSAATCRRRSSTAAPLADEFRRALPADLRAGHGQGHRGHRLLPLVPPRRGQRGRRPPRPPVDLRRRVPRVVRRRWSTTLADVDDDAHDPRHEAVRGRARPAHGARRGRRGLGDVAARAPATLAAPTAPSGVDGPTEYLVWQTLVGTWPITGARLEEYLLKAVREAKVHTAWVDGDPDYEDDGRGLRQGAVPRPRRAAAPRRVDHRPRAVGAGQRAVAEADPADHARRPGRLPGLRDRRPLARRPRQPPPRRLDRPRRAARAGAVRRAGLRPRRREAAGHRPRPAVCAATCPACFVGRAHDVRRAAHHERARARLRPRR